MTGRLLPLLSLIAAVGIFFAYISPLWNGDIAQAKAAIAADNQALTSAAEYVKRENELATEADKIDQASLARLKVFLPDSVDNVGLILDLNALAAKSGLSLSSVDVAQSSAASTDAAAATTDPIGTIDMTLAAKGTYDALHAFLEGIERSERLLDVRDLTVSGTDTGVYTYQMTVRIYWLR